ncbi:unnamed protein product [Mucor hiemalis]
MVHEWKNNYSWKKTCEKLNRWHHYRTKVNGLNIHFVHEPSSNKDAIPIILIHGWPSTFYEFYKLIEPLRDSPRQAFHVIVPSLPGYGFSDAPKAPGFGIPDYANTLHELMIDIGYDKYMIFGTDWGSPIGDQMAKDYASHVIGFLTSMPGAYPPVPTLRNIMSHPYKVLLFLLAIVFGLETIYGKKETKKLSQLTYANVDKCEDAGYRAIQSTRPYTLSYGLSDSPVGLLGWMLEPYHVWSFHQPSEANTSSIPKTMTTDEFLTQVTIYWMTNTMSSSCRIYYEAKRNNMKSLIDLAKRDMKVLYGVSYFETETKSPRDWIETYSDHLIQFKIHDQGGHFAGIEEPDMLMEDIQQFASRLKINKNDKKNV